MTGVLNVGLAGELRLLAPQRCFPLRRQHAGSDRSDDAKTGAVSQRPKTIVSKIATVPRIRIIVSRPIRLVPAFRLALRDIVR